MPEPAATTSSSPPPMWPAGLPDPQTESMQVVGPPRVERCQVLYGPTRARVTARTAPMTLSFTCFLTPAQMEAFEDWYTDIARDNDGEFYARWIGGSRVVAFSAPYTLRALGAGWALSGTVVRTRIDITACDAFIESVFGALYRDDGVAPNLYVANLTAVDRYKSDFDLSLIVDNEC